MSQDLKIIQVTCNAKNCFFVKVYDKTTLAIVKNCRKIIQKIPCIDNECTHKDVSYRELKIAY